MLAPLSRGGPAAADCQLRSGGARRPAAAARAPATRRRVPCLSVAAASWPAQPGGPGQAQRPDLSTRALAEPAAKKGDQKASKDSKHSSGSKEEAGGGKRVVLLGSGWGANSFGALGPAPGPDVAPPASRKRRQG